jgi:predicted transcriptional regulator
MKQIDNLSRRIARHRTQIEVAIDRVLASGRFARVYNNWKDERPRFLGVNLGGRMPGYRFALYQRIENSELAREN